MGIMQLPENTMLGTTHRSGRKTDWCSNTTNYNYNSLASCRLRLFLPIFSVLLMGWAHWVTQCVPPTPSSLRVSMFPTATTATTSKPDTLQQQRRRQRKIYIDLGVNCGNSYYLFQQGGVIGSRTTLSDNDWEAYLWEANPQMIDWYLNDLVQTEQAKGRQVTLIPKAAATTNTTISFFLTKGQEIGTAKNKLPNAGCDPKSPYNPSGASSMYRSALRAGQEIQVPAVDFFAWFQQLQLHAGDIVHIKMDIEGAELDIIERFLNDDTTHQICFWSQFWTEYHATIFPVGSIEYQLHAEFQKTFPQRFEDKCGRPLWPNGVLK